METRILVQCQWVKHLVTSYLLGHAICDGYIDQELMQEKRLASNKRFTLYMIKNVH